MAKRLPAYHGWLQGALIQLFETHITLRPGYAGTFVDADPSAVCTALRRLARNGELTRVEVNPQHVEYFMTDRQRWVAFGPPDPAWLVAA